RRGWWGSRSTPSTWMTTRRAPRATTRLAAPASPPPTRCGSTPARCSMRSRRRTGGMSGGRNRPDSSRSPERTQRMPALPPLGLLVAFLAPGAPPLADAEARLYRVWDPATLAPLVLAAVRVESRRLTLDAKAPG